jgi:prevent-host-death family protein
MGIMSVIVVVRGPIHAEAISRWLPARLPGVEVPLEWHIVRTELVTTLKRRATEIIAELESDPAPVLITQHGKPAAYLMAVSAFETLNRRLAILEGIARGERAVEDGRVVSHDEARKRMARWLN